MDGEINLRPYLDALWSKAPLIIIVTLIAAFAGFVISNFLAPNYKASALVALRQPRYNLDFDSRIQVEGEDIKSVYDALPILATSDELFAQLTQSDLITIDPSLSSEDLRNALTTEQMAKPTLIKFSATHGDPQYAAELANAWAILLVERANAVYAGQGSGQVEFFSNQLQTAEQELAAAQAELSTFAAANEKEILSNRLEALLTSQFALLEKQGLLTLLKQDVDSLLNQLETAPTNSVLGQGDQLAALLIQIRAFNSQSEIPLQMQIGNAEPSAASTTAEQRLYLTNLQDTLNQQASAIDIELNILTPQILLLQKDIQENLTVETELIDAAELARETHTILARKMEESNIAKGNESGLVQLASRASVPTSPASPNKLINAIAAGLLGFIIVSAVVIVWQWRKGAVTA